MRLKHPIQRISASTGQVVDEVSELVFRRPKLGDLIAAMDAAGPGAPRGTVILALAARLAGVSTRDLEGLDIEDGLAVIDEVGGFMPAGPRTGSDGSPSSPAASASLPTGGTGGQPNSASGVVVPLSGSA